MLAIKLKILLTVFTALMVTSVSICQYTALNKAVKHGCGNDYLYKAEFRNLKTSKKQNIYDWAVKEGYTISSINTTDKVRFGGSKKTYIASVYFISNEDLAYKSALSSNDLDVKVNFVSNYSSHNQIEKIKAQILSETTTIETAARVANSLPQLYDRLEEKSFTISQTLNDPADYDLFCSKFGKGRFRKDALFGICNTVSTISECAKYSKKHPDAAKCLESQALAIVKKEKVLTSFSNFLLYFPKSNHYEKVAKILYTSIKTIKDCATYGSKHNSLRSSLHKKAEKIAERDGIEGKRRYCNIMKKGIKYASYKRQVEKHDLDTKLEENKAALKKQKLEQQRRAERQKAKIDSISNRERKVISRSNLNKWNLGDKLCRVTDSGETVQGIITKFNANKTNIRIKILGGPNENLEGQQLTKGAYIWSPVDSWYKCIGDENINYQLSTRDEIQSKKIKPITHENTYKYSFGDVVSCSTYENNSGWKGVVVNKQDGKYQVEITKVTVNGWFATQLNASSCSGNKVLTWEDGRYNKVYIWVSEDCLD